MDRLIYTAMTGARQSFLQQAGVAHNLSNASTVGFRAMEHRFRAVPVQGEGMPTRAFVADASVANEIHVVGMHVTRMLMRALKDPETPSDEIEPTEEDIAIAKVIGDVWLASLVQWVTGRSSAADVSKSMDVAVRLLLR